MFSVLLVEVLLVLEESNQVIKIGEEVEVVGLDNKIGTTTVTGVEMFQKLLMKVKLVIMPVFY